MMSTGVREAVKTLVESVEGAKDYLIRYESDGYPMLAMEVAAEWLKATEVDIEGSELQVREGDARMQDLATEVYRIVTEQNCKMEMMVLENGSVSSVFFPDSELTLTLRYPEPFQLLKATEATIIHLKELYSA